MHCRRSVTVGSWFGWRYPTELTERSVSPWDTREIFEVVTAVKINTVAFWDATSCSLIGNNILRKSVGLVHLAGPCCKFFQNLKFYQNARHHVREDSNFHWWEILRLMHRTGFWNSEPVVEKSKQQYTRVDCLSVVIERVQDCCCLWCPSWKVNVSNILSKPVPIKQEETPSIPTFSA